MTVHLLHFPVIVEDTNFEIWDKCIHDFGDSDLCHAL